MKHTVGIFFLIFLLMVTPSKSYRTKMNDIFKVRVLKFFLIFSWKQEYEVWHRMKDFLMLSIRALEVSCQCFRAVVVLPMLAFCFLILINFLVNFFFWRLKK